MKYAVTVVDGHTMYWSSSYTLCNRPKQSGSEAALATIISKGPVRTIVTIIDRHIMMFSHFSSIPCNLARGHKTGCSMEENKKVCTFLYLCTSGTKQKYVFLFILRILRRMGKSNTYQVRVYSGVYDLYQIHVCQFNPTLPVQQCTASSISTARKGGKR